MLKNIKHLVLEAGGTKCAWQAGFLAALEDRSCIRPDFISAVSASSAIACAMISRRLEWAVECFKSCIAGNEKNIYLSGLLSRRPIFPHAGIYRETLVKTFDQSAVEALHSGPEIKILVTRTSLLLPGYAGVFAGLSMHALNGLKKHELYHRLHARIGFSKEFISVKKCRTPAELADLVLASSCTPPVTPLYSYSGRTALDGGLIESVPISGLPEQPNATLVLLTRKGNRMNRHPRFVYSEPSEEPHVASWDYTDPAKIDYLYAMGKKDGNTFAEGADRGGLSLNS